MRVAVDEHVAAAGHAVKQREDVQAGRAVGGRECPGDTIGVGEAAFEPLQGLVVLPLDRPPSSPTEGL